MISPNRIAVARAVAPARRSLEGGQDNRDADPAGNLIIVAVLTALGSSDPQVRAHIRALRAIDVPWNEIEETILQTTPYAGIPRAVNAMKVLREEKEGAK